MKSLGCVYFIEAEGLNRIKIGFARHDLNDRLTTLQTSCPVKLRVLGYIEEARWLEAVIHARFAHLRLHGEWFEASTELRDYIREHAVEGSYKSGDELTLKNFRLPAETNQQLREIADETGWNETEIIKRAVEEAFRKKHGIS